MAKKYSIIIPSYDPRGEKIDIVMDTIRSVEANSIGKDYEIIISKNGKSYVESHNEGLKTAKGDFLVVLNDDVIIKDRLWLEKLCIGGYLCSWKSGTLDLTNEFVPDFACWAVSRAVFEKIGLFDEIYRDGISYEDNDYWYTARSKDIPSYIANIDMVHIGEQTIGKYNQIMDEKVAKINKNKEIFIKKWNL